MNNNKLIIGLLAVLVVLQLVVSAKVAFGPEVVKLAGPRGPQGPAGAMGASADDTTNWISGYFSSDLTVGDRLIIEESSTSSPSGYITIPKMIKTTITTATSTACSVLNDSGVRRIVLGYGVMDRGTAASTGSVTWSVGTSTYPGTSSTSPWTVSSSITRANGRDVITTTSSMMSAYSTWGTGEYVNWMVNTTTNAGSCYILYY